MYLKRIPDEVAISFLKNILSGKGKKKNMIDILIYMRLTDDYRYPYREIVHFIRANCTYGYDGFILFDEIACRIKMDFKDSLLDQITKEIKYPLLCNFGYFEIDMLSAYNYIKYFQPSMSTFIRKRRSLFMRNCKDFIKRNSIYGIYGIRKGAKMSQIINFNDRKCNRDGNDNYNYYSSDDIDQDNVMMMEALARKIANLPVREKIEEDI